MNRLNNTIACFRVGISADTDVMARCLHSVGFPTIKLGDEGASIKGCGAVVYTVPNSSGRLFETEHLCRDMGVPAIYAFAFGWGAVVTVLSPDGQSIRRISDDAESIGTAAAQRVADYGRHTGEPYLWLEDYLSGNDAGCPAAGEYAAAAITANILWCMATGAAVCRFPKFYVASPIP